MVYPKLQNAPIKETIFSISYEEIVDENCFNKFVELDFIKNSFPSISPGIILEINSHGINKTKNDGFHLRNENEVLQIRPGSFSYHFLNTYCEYEKILENIIKFWKAFSKTSKNNFTITSVNIRYINVIQVDKENPASRLVQLYPKQSSDRNIVNFQNSVNFTYKDYPQYIINAVTTKPKQDMVLLDISVSHQVINNKSELILLFKPLQEIKNKVFFDSITARALKRYI